MPYNKAKAEKKWRKWKAKEEAQLKQLGVTDNTIILLREFDWDQFKEDRRFNERQDLYDESFFARESISNQNYSYLNFNQLLNELDDIDLFDCVKNTDSLTQSIIVLRVNDYTTSDISTILNISPNIIYKKTYKLRDKWRKKHAHNG